MPDDDDIEKGGGGDKMGAKFSLFTVMLKNMFSS